MAYKRFSMDCLPPSLRKNKFFTFNDLNTLITNAFKNTTITKTVSCDNKFQTSTRVYLESTNIDKVESVQIMNRIGDELEYTVYENTGTYSNYIDLNRPLLVGESLNIKFKIKPNKTDLLDNFMDVVYLRSDIYETLIDLIYNYIYTQKGELKKDGKH